jgi:decaprenyl-phosphate phosphoribosyltransferase
VTPRTALPVDGTPAGGATATATAAGIFRLLRPKQWAKNVLVFAAPGAAGVLTEPTALLHTLVAFVAFCLAASGTYCLNDARDVEADRLHPRKRLRPLASGAVPVALGRVLGVGLVLAGVLVAALAGGWELPAVVGGYVALTTAYTLKLKYVAVVDLAAVAAGFVLRAIAGAAATDVTVSEWFLIVASFGSLFMVAGKRSAELARGAGSIGSRSTLAAYTPPFLIYVRSVASGIAMLAYCLWAFEKAEAAAVDFPWFQVSILPFVLAILRYALLIDAGEGEAPEDVVLEDRTLQLLGLLWALTFLAGVELG